MFEFNLPVAFIPEDYREFLPTLATPAVDELLLAYERGATDMRRLHKQLMSDETRPILECFADGAEAYKKANVKGFWAMEFLELFNLDRAINARQEKFWFQLFDLCNLTNILPADLWEQWSDSFTGWRTFKSNGKSALGMPQFNRTNVFTVISLIEGHRANFFSMRIDAIWRALSGYHVTNWGGAFHKRFIMNNVFNEWGSVDHDKMRVVQDLYNACTTIMTGAEDPFYKVAGALESARGDHCGQWVEVIEGVLRIKGFMVGTLHAEIHPEIANRLNIALAYLHPNCLPDEAIIKRPRRKAGFGSRELIQATVPPQVRYYLRMTRQQQDDNGLWRLRFCKETPTAPKIGPTVKMMIDDVLGQVGGMRDGDDHLFDYAPADVIAELVATGEVPEKVSHQFYSTSADLAQEFVAWVGVESDAVCYETSAGTGGIAKHMPLQTYCVEVDRLRALSLDRQGFEVTQADFLKLKPSDLVGEVDAVLMNPPFAGRAWQDHFEHAVQFVRQGGVIGAILPEGAVRKMPSVMGLEVTYSEPLRNRFKDASISVVFAKWVRAVVSAPAQADYAFANVVGL